MCQTPIDRKANLEYVCDMLVQLKVVASSSGGPLLVYLIDLAQNEAADRLQTKGPSRKQRNTSA